MFSMPFRAGFFGVDQFRYGMEQMHPAAYLLSPVLRALGAHRGALRRGEGPPRRRPRSTGARSTTWRTPTRRCPSTRTRSLLAFVDGPSRPGAPRRATPDKAAKFAVGDRVTVDRRRPEGHTRKARYIRGKTGVIELAHGTMIYPDTAGNGRGEAPEHVYTVRFTNEELWGAEDARAQRLVSFDVWEPYIVPASQ